MNILVVYLHERAGDEMFFIGFTFGDCYYLIECSWYYAF